MPFLDDFFIRALVGGLGVAIIAGPLGCFIVWRRLAYFGDTIAHASLLGVALSILFDTNTTLLVFITAVFISIFLLVLRLRGDLAGDSILGMLSHSTLAIGLVIISFMTWIRVDIGAFLFGDILSMSKIDLIIIYVSGAVILVVTIVIWKPFFAITVDEEIAKSEGINTRLIEFVYMVLIAATIAVAIKLVGILLMASLLIIPALSARNLVTSPEKMAFIASIIGCISVCLGLYSSLNFDSPSGPSIVVVAFFIFLLSRLLVPVYHLVRDKLSKES